MSSQHRKPMDQMSQAIRLLQYAKGDLKLTRRMEAEKEQTRQQFQKATISLQPLYADLLSQAEAQRLERQASLQSRQRERLQHYQEAQAMDKKQRKQLRKVLGRH